jgi:hypothetical protein
MCRQWRAGVWNWGDTTFESRRCNKGRTDPRDFWVRPLKSCSLCVLLMLIFSYPCLFSSSSRLFYRFHSLPFQNLEWSPFSARFIWYHWFLVLTIERHLFAITDFWYVVHVLWFPFLISCFLSSAFTSFDRSFHSLPHRRSNLLIRV